MPADQPTASANPELAARIVAAYVRRNQVGSDQIPALISTVHQALAGLGKCESKEAGPRIPAVSLRESVRPDYLVCLDCGRRSKMLRRHLVDAHGLSTDEYRKRWNLRSDYPMVAPAYRVRRSGLAKAVWTWPRRTKIHCERHRIRTGVSYDIVDVARHTATSERVKVHGRDFLPANDWHRSPIQKVSLQWGHSPKSGGQFLLSGTVVLRRRVGAGRLFD